MPLPIDEKYVIDCEKELGIRFPEAYRIAMMEDNGGELDLDEGWQLFPIKNLKDRKTISRTINHVIAETNKDRLVPGFPSSGISIADSGTGDRLIFLVDKGRRLEEAVFFWSHEKREVFEYGHDIGDLLAHKL